MKILCLVKLVPDVENFKYDYDKNVLVRDGVHLVINPEDATALAHALDLKVRYPGISVETLTMAPEGVIPHLEDLIRRGVERSILISDTRFAGSDTIVTSRILARYIQTQDYDYVFAGTHSLDGGTAHVPAQIAAALDIAHLSHIMDIHGDSFSSKRAVVDVDDENAILTFEIDAPAVLGLSYSTALKLPYIPYDQISLQVRDDIVVMTNDDLGLHDNDVGLRGSRTRVAAVEVKTLDKKDTVLVGNDDAGMDVVWGFLADKGFIPQ